jgi:hypothetical protein
MAQTWFVKAPTVVADTRGKSSLVATFDALENKVELAFDDVADSLVDGVITYKGDIVNTAAFAALHTAGTIATGSLYTVSGAATDAVTGQSFEAGDEVFWAGAAWVATGMPIPTNLVTTSDVLTADMLIIGNDTTDVAVSAKSISDVVSDANALTVAAPDEWADPDPVTLKAAIDRIAHAVFVLQTNTPIA